MFRFTILVLSLTLAGAAMAQSKTIDSPYSRISLGFEAQHMSFEMNEEGRSSQGLSLAYTRGYLFSQSVPVGMEASAKLAWTHREDGGRYVTTKEDFLSLSLPVDFTYRFILSDSGLGLAPFTGPNFRFNILGRRQLSTDADRENFRSINYLSRDADCLASIFQFGWRVGVNLYFRRFFLGYAFTYDLNHYVDEARADYGVAGNAGEAKTSCHTVAFGYTF